MIGGNVHVFKIFGLDIIDRLHLTMNGAERIFINPQ